MNEYSEQENLKASRVSVSEEKSKRKKNFSLISNLKTTHIATDNDMLHGSLYEHIKLNTRVDEETDGYKRNRKIDTFYRKKLENDIIESKWIHQGFYPRDLGKFHDSEILSMAISHDSNSLFTSDDKGILKQFNLKNLEFEHNYGFIHNTRINSICCSELYVYTSDIQGNINQLSISEKNICHEYKKICESSILSIACTKKCQYQVATDDTGHLKQIDTNKNIIVKDYSKIFDCSIFTVTITNNGKFCFVASEDGGLKQYDLKEKIITSDYGKIHEGSIYSICCSPNSQILFTSDDNGCQKQLDTDKKKLIYDYGEIHSGRIKSMVVSIDSKYLYTTDNTATLKEISIDHKKILKTHEFVSSDPGTSPTRLRTTNYNHRLNMKKSVSMTGTIEEELNSIVCSSEDQITCDNFGKIKQIPIADKILFNSYSRFIDKITSIKCSPHFSYDNKILIAGGNQLVSYNIYEKKIMKDFGKIHKGNISCVTCNLTFLFTADDRGEVKQWDANSEVIVMKYSYAHDCSINKQVCSDDNKWLFSADAKGCVNQFDIQKKRCVFSYPMTHRSGIIAQACSPDSKYLITSGYFGRLKQFTIEYTNDDKPSLVYDMEYKKVFDGMVTAQVYTPDCKYFFSGDSTGRLKQFSTYHKEKMMDFGKCFKYEITCLVVSSDSRCLYASSNGGQLKQFSVEHQVILKDYSKIHDCQILSIEISMDLRFLFTSDIDGNLKKLDLEKFTSGKSNLSPHNDYLVPLGVDYFNFNRDLNFLSSLILNHLALNKLTILKEFLTNNHMEIIDRYAQVNYISKTDILTYLYACVLLDLVHFIPSFFATLVKNPKAPRKSLNGIAKYISNSCTGKSKYIGTKVFKYMADYQFKHQPFFKQGSMDLIKQRRIFSNDSCQINNIEHLCKDTFQLPKKYPPIINIDVYMLNFRVNLANPNDEFYYYMLSLYKFVKDNEAVVTDRKIKGLIDGLWCYYKFPLKIYLFFYLITQIALYVQGFLIAYYIGQDKMKNHIISWGQLIAAFILLIYEILHLLASGIKNYFSRFGNYIDLLSIALYHVNSLMMINIKYIAELSQDEKCLVFNIYSLTILFGFLKLIVNLNMTGPIRRLAFRMQAMVGSIYTLSGVTVLFVICFTHIFYFTSFRLSDEDASTSYKQTAIQTYDMLFNHWTLFVKENYLGNDPFTYFFFIMMTFGFPLIIMRFIVAITTDTLRNCAPKVQYANTKIKYEYVIECIEFRRLINGGLWRKCFCKKKKRAAQLYGSVIETTNKDIDLLAENVSYPIDINNFNIDSDAPTFSVENPRNPRIETSKPYEYYVYLVFEKEDALLGKKSDPMNDYLKNMDMKMDEMKMRLDLIDDINKKIEGNDEMKRKINIIFDKLCGLNLKEI